MKRIATIAAAALLAAGCGSDSNQPSVSQVVVTTSVDGIPAPGTTVYACADVSSATLPYQCIGLVATQTTNPSAQTTFTVPGSTSTGSLCFLVNNLGGGTSSLARCFSLNNLPGTLILDPILPGVRAP